MPIEESLESEIAEDPWRNALFSLGAWRRRGVFFFAAIATGLAALFFNEADRLSTAFRGFLLDGERLFGLELDPQVGTFVAMGLAVSGMWLVMTLRDRYFPGSQGTGIPQVMASLETEVDDPLRRRMLSWRIASGKTLLLLIGIFAGATIGREGPSVHVGACLFLLTARWARFPRFALKRGLILTGGAAGIAAAFNAPIAGAIFAIEEIGRSFEKKSVALILLGVAVACTACWVMLGDYVFYGRIDPAFTSPAQWFAIIPIAALCGLLGGLFSNAVVAGTRFITRNLRAHRVLVPLGLGLALALLGLFSGGQSYGSGYDEARAILIDGSQMPVSYAFTKAAGSFVSLISGIPGGLFDPSFSVGAALGQLFAPFFAGIDPLCIVMIAMTSYFSGIVRSPITAVVILLEMTTARDMAMPLFMAAVIATEASKLVAKTPIYEALADLFLEGVRSEEAERPRE
jgi:H+/Cl- antiporter ClcA